MLVAANHDGDSRPIWRRKGHLAETCSPPRVHSPQALPRATGCPLWSSSNATTAKVNLLDALGEDFAICQPSSRRTPREASSAC